MIIAFIITLNNIKEQMQKVKSVLNKGISQSNAYIQTNKKAVAFLQQPLLLSVDFSVK